MLPQFLLTGLIMVGVGVTLARWGQKKTDTYDSGDLLGACIVLGLLWWGGFYS